MAKLNALGTALLYSSYLGGNGNEDAIGVAVDKTGRVYVTGRTFSTDFPTTPDSLQPDYGGGQSGIGGDAFIVKLFDPPPFDICVEDESNGSLLQINTTTGDYEFTNCSGFTVSGTGSLTARGCTLTLQDSRSDRRVVAKIDTCLNRATASIQIFSQGATLTITDRNTNNNTCACQQQ